MIRLYTSSQQHPLAATDRPHHPHTARLLSLFAALAAVIILAFLLTTVPAHAQEFTRDPATITADEVNAVAKQMYCLECENIPLDVCGTQACIQWRDEIRLQLAEGRTPNEILEYFRVNHGEQALAIPADPFLRGLSTLTPYILAAFAVIAAGAVVLGWRANPPAAPNDLAPPTANLNGHDSYAARLEHDVESQK